MKKEIMLIHLHLAETFDNHIKNITFFIYIFPAAPQELSKITSLNKVLGML